jgi:Ulp1 protease family, C-terminal catalytic domain
LHLICIYKFQRRGIQFLISLALGSDLLLQNIYKSVDITKWSVVVIKTPQQQDNHSCGLFALKFIESWCGAYFKSDRPLEVSLFNKIWDIQNIWLLILIWLHIINLQIQAELFRKQLVYYLIFSEKNKLKKVQDDIKKKFEPQVRYFMHSLYIFLILLYITMYIDNNYI